MMSKKISTTVYLTESQDTRLKLLSARTKAPVAAFIREALDQYLAKHQPETQPVNEAEEGAG